MSLRVTSASLSRGVMDGLQANLARVQRTQVQLSSGRRINKVSDSPVDAAAAMRLRALQASSQQVGRNVDDGLSALGAADSALTSVSTLLQRIRQLVVSGLNDTNNAGDRANIATEIDQLKDGLIALANTQYLGRPIFAGTQDVPAAFDTATGQYLGNGDAVQRSVSTDGSTRMSVTVTGEDAFSTLLSDGNALGILSRITAELRDPNGSAALSADLGNLDVASAIMQNTHSVIGSRYNRLLGIQTSGETTLDAVSAKLSMAENIDLAKTIIDMQVQSTAYQAALGAAAKIIQPSLLDFLR
jgi:flagellar hook-associated protein 3 FlgL